MKRRTTTRFGFHCSALGISLQCIKNGLKRVAPDPERKRKQAQIYAETGRMQEAYKAYEELLFTDYQRVSMELHGIYLLALKENDMEKARSIVQKQAEAAKFFEMGKYYEVSGFLEIAALEKDADTVIAAMEEMLSQDEALIAGAESAEDEADAFDEEYEAEEAEALEEEMEDAEELLEEEAADSDLLDAIDDDEFEAGTLRGLSAENLRKLEALKAGMTDIREGKGRRK